MSDPLALLTISSSFMEGANKRSNTILSALSLQSCSRKKLVTLPNVPGISFIKCKKRSHQQLLCPVGVMDLTRVLSTFSNFPLAVDRNDPSR